MSASEAIARLRELRAKATAGEWKYSSHPGEAIPMLHIFCADNKGPAYHERSQSELEANAAAIVAAMNSLDALLECASMLSEMIGPDSKAHYDTAEERKARAALQALAEGGA